MPGTSDRGLEKRVAEPRLAREPTVRSGLVVGAVALAVPIGPSTPGARQAVVALGCLTLGAVPSLLAAWTWWRITKSYLTFIRRFQQAET